MPKAAFHQELEPEKAAAGNPEAEKAAEAAAGPTAAGGSPDLKTEPGKSTPEESQKNGLRVKSGHRAYYFYDLSLTKEQMS